MRLNLQLTEISFIAVTGTIIVVEAWRHNADFRSEVHAALRMSAGAMILSLLILIGMLVKTIMMAGVTYMAH